MSTVSLTFLCQNIEKKILKLKSYLTIIEKTGKLSLLYLFMRRDG